MGDQQSQILCLEKNELKALNIVEKRQRFESCKEIDAVKAWCLPVDTPVLTGTTMHCRKTENQ